jgi:hypothetical protein
MITVNIIRVFNKFISKVFFRQSIHHEVRKIKI